LAIYPQHVGKIPFTLCNMDLATTSAFLASAITCTLLAFGLRAFFWKQMRALGGARTTSLPSVIVEQPLRPAELAYLSHDGDMGHTMVVLVVDLIQRVIKSRGEEELQLEPYERVIIANVKDFVKKWATEKVGEIVPPKHQLRNPVQWFIRIRAIKTFFGGTLRQFVRDFVKDPLHIRKYFSWSGIARFTVTLLTSNARGAVESSMQSQLLQRNLLVPPQRRQKFAYSILFLIPLMVAAAFLLQQYFFPSGKLINVCIIFAMGLLNAAGLRAVISLPSLIPSYDEFSKIAAELPRAGLRMALIKNALRFSRLLVGWLTVVSSVILLAIEFGIDTALLRMTPAEALPLLIAGTLLSLPAVQAILDFHSLSTRDHASSAAEHLIETSNREVSNLSPLSSLKEMLTDPEYDPVFSRILAVYGVETLWLLG
jgi:hypothetical protein